MKSILKTLCLFSIFFCLFSAYSQAPEKMSYQAVIRNASNTLITNQPVGMRVSILQGSATGTEVYKELFNPNPQTNINGLVTVEIGTGIPLTGTFSGIDWASGPYFIKTETDPTGGASYTIVGTSQLMSVPYALYAKFSENSASSFSLPYSGTSATDNVIPFKITNSSATLNQVGYFENTNSTNSAPAITGKNNSVDSFGVGIQGIANSNTNGNVSAGVSGYVSGIGNAGAGVLGQSENAYGVYGVTTNGYGVRGYAYGTGIAGSFQSANSGFALNTYGPIRFNAINEGVGKVLTSDGLGNATWQSLPSSNAGWELTGNIGIIDGTNFLGTTDNIALNFKVNNTKAGRIGVATDKNTFLGYEAGLNDGLNYSENTFVGYQAGMTNTTGAYNIAIGSSALFFNTTGSNNTTMGVNALYSNTTGSENTATGINALLANTTGNDNTAAGMNALRSNTTGFNNTAIGVNSLYSSTTGRENTAMGVNALSYNTTGAYNVAIGSSALFLNSIGFNNTAMGESALYSNTTGSENTATGKGALRSNTTGINNTANGQDALYSNSTGNDNTAMGESALYSNTTGSENTATGKGALRSNTTGINNTANGQDALRSNTTGINNLAIGRAALYYNSTGNNNIAIGYNTQVPSATGSNQVRIGNTFITYAGTQVAWSVTSDRRLKENIYPSNLGLNFINDLKPVSYIRKDDATKKSEYGIIAQELEASLNKFGATTNGIINIDDKGMYSVRYNDLLAPIIKAIQEQQIMIQKQQVMIEELKVEIKTLKNSK